jgi:hypothetical protein
MQGIRKKPVRPSNFPPYIIQASDNLNRLSNTVSISLRNPQILHLHPRPAHHLHHAEGCARAEGLGLGYREADDEGGESYQEGDDPGAEASEEEVMYE